MRFCRGGVESAWRRVNRKDVEVNESRGECLVPGCENCADERGALNSGVSPCCLLSSWNQTRTHAHAHAHENTQPRTHGHADLAYLDLGVKIKG